MIMKSMELICFLILRLKPLRNTPLSTPLNNSSGWFLQSTRFFSYKSPLRVETIDSLRETSLIFCCRGAGLLFSVYSDANAREHGYDIHSYVRIDQSHCAHAPESWNASYPNQLAAQSGFILSRLLIFWGLFDL